MADTQYTRLHITPFTPSLLNTYLPSSILPNARNISYHTIQTFPERAYGFVELPTMDAEKIKKKLNGSILKGTKVRIETARPEKEKVALDPEDKEAKVKREKGKKRKRDEIPAVDIGERSVKRGWTVPATKVGKDNRGEKKSKVEKSKFTNEPECLFKTVLPPNVASKGSSAAATSESKKKKERKGKETVVHEFSKATKYATFLRSSNGGSKNKTSAEYIKGKGWVDEDGNLIEAVKGGTRVVEKKSPEKTNEDDDEDSSSDEEKPTRAEKSVQTVKSIQTATKSQEPKDDTSDSDSSEEDSDDEAAKLEEPKAVSKLPQEDASSPNGSSSDSSSDEEIQEEAESKAKETPVIKVSKADSVSSSSSDSDSSTDTSSSSESDSESDSDSPSSPTKTISTSRPQSSSGPPTGLSITIPPNPAATATSVHPLEALYKRSKPNLTSTPAKPSAPAFSFFGADEDNDDIDMDDREGNNEPQVPLTPYTQRDFEWRGLRSAAPTPDTAFANKRFVWPGEDDEDEDEQESTPLKSGKGKGKEKETQSTNEKNAVGGEETEFQKWFYEHRGEANRAWKKRRKVVAKEKRQRENRKRQDR